MRSSLLLLPLVFLATPAVAAPTASHTETTTYTVTRAAPHMVVAGRRLPGYGGNSTPSLPRGLRGPDAPLASKTSDKRVRVTLSDAVDGPVRVSVVQVSPDGKPVVLAQACGTATAKLRWPGQPVYADARVGCAGTPVAGDVTAVFTG